jgi:hypothetical protein
MHTGLIQKDFLLFEISVSNLIFTFKTVKYSRMRFEVLTAVKMSILVFWVVTQCGLVGRYQRFGGTYCLHLQP